jgi:hypothetical protein
MAEGACPVCGAPRTAGASCAYCKSGGSVFSLGGLASITRRDASTLEALLPSLAVALEEALPGQVRVERGGGLLHRGGDVRGLEAQVGDHLFAIRRSGRRTETSIVHRIRGVALKHEQPPVPVWLDRLADSLAAHAAGSVDVGPHLRRLIGD